MRCINSADGNDRENHCAGKTVNQPPSRILQTLKNIGIERSGKLISSKSLHHGLPCLCFVSSLILPAVALSQSMTTDPAVENAARQTPENVAVKQIDDAVTVVRRLEADATMRQVMQNAQGVFIVPNYGRIALGVGGQAGAGVLLVKRSGQTWSDPAFFNIGGVGVGAQAGIEAGPIALVLNNQKAIQRFTKVNNFSLSADAGISVVNWSKLAQGSTGAGDVVAWSGTKGLFGNLVTVSANDIRLNQKLTNTDYRQPVTVMDVINGKVKTSGAESLKQALVEVSSGSASGRSTGETESTSGQKK
jgi:lipid-binding SYLF domain-containing protein